ncbi:MAG: (d)CMP kinase [Clostridiaceae bacterium]|nr:(d)CMP kinase [Clostridiaceae bacterium]
MISIAIDGPAGAGKSTVAKAVAEELGIFYLDTGAMYRTVALKAIRGGISTTDREKLSSLVNDIDMKIAFEGKEQHMILDGEDVTELIRSPEISIGASNVSAIPEVRIKMTELQRKFASENNVVMEGRDIGTHVLPGATIKIFLVASAEKRAERRYKQLLEKGEKNISLEEITKEIEYRDKNDSSREFAPLLKADDAIEIDTTDLTVYQVANKIMNYVKQKVEI